MRKVLTFIVLVMASCLAHASPASGEPIIRASSILVRISDVDTLKTLENVNISILADVQKMERHPDGTVQIWPSPPNREDVILHIQTDAEAYYGRRITMLLHGFSDRQGRVSPPKDASFYLAKKNRNIPTLDSVSRAASHISTDPDRALVLLDRMRERASLNNYGRKFDIALTFQLAEAHYASCVHRNIDTCGSSLRYYERLKMMRSDDRNEDVFKSLRLPDSKRALERLEEQSFRMDYRLAHWFIRMRDYQGALDQLESVLQRTEDRCDGDYECLRAPVSGINQERLVDDICSVKQRLGRVVMCP